MTKHKFRCWRKDIKEFTDDFVITPDGKVLVGALSIMDDWGATVYFEGNAKMSDNFVLVSYAEKLDCNGKQIFVGDILKDDTGDILEVKFGELPLGKSSDCVCTYPAFYCKSYGQLGVAPSEECQEIGDWMEIIGLKDEE